MQKTCSVFCTTRWLTVSRNSSFRRTEAQFWPLWALHACAAYKRMQSKTHMYMKRKRILRKKGFSRISLRGHRYITGKEGGMVGREGVVTPCTQSRRRSQRMQAAHTLPPFYSVRDHTIGWCWPRSLCPPLPTSSHKPRGLSLRWLQIRSGWPRRLTTTACCWFSPIIEDTGTLNPVEPQISLIWWSGLQRMLWEEASIRFLSPRCTGCELHVEALSWGCV